MGGGGRRKRGIFIGKFIWYFLSISLLVVSHFPSLPPRLFITVNGSSPVISVCVCVCDDKWPLFTCARWLVSLGVSLVTSGRSNIRQDSDAEA